MKWTDFLFPLITSLYYDKNETFDKQIILSAEYKGNINPLRIEIFCT